MEDLDDVSISEDFPEHTIQIRSKLTPEFRARLIEFLKKHHNCFAWSHEDMTGIDPNIIVHKLRVDPDYPPIKQKRRKFAPKRSMKRSKS